MLGNWLLDLPPTLDRWVRENPGLWPGSSVQPAIAVLTLICQTNNPGLSKF